VSRARPVLYELMESVEGPNILEEFLEERGEGLHHLGYIVPDIDAEISEMKEKGYPLLQSGRGFGKDGDGAYALFDTERDFGCILEALEMSREMRPPTGPTPKRAKSSLVVR
jgi:methylmalonyl-CoA/ethylmalonyl-CoA epimerase